MSDLTHDPVVVEPLVPEEAQPDLTAPEVVLMLTMHRLCKGDTDLFFPFKVLERETRYNRELVKGLCRSLKLQGYADFQSGLMDDEGAFIGTGYGLTKAGLRLLYARQDP